MYLKEKLSQHRRDFRGVFKCQECDHEVERVGYDDTFYHHNVIPTMVCSNCGATGCPDDKLTHPDVPEGVVM